jgi:hypothetical protein
VLDPGPAHRDGGPGERARPAFERQLSVTITQPFT